jgi:intracellular multiplication protein IcmL
MKSSASGSSSAPKKHPSLSALIKQSDLTIMKISIILVGVCLLIFAWSFYDRKHKPAPRYFEVLNETELKRMQALRYPNLSTQVVLKWAVEAATAAYTFDFYNYQSVFKGIRPYFTKVGYDNFIAAIKGSGLITRVIEKKIIVSAVVTGSPVIMREGPIVGGVYAWQVQFPMLLTYQSQSDQSDSKVVATLLIAQVPTIESSKGIGIASFITVEAVK